MKLPPSRGTKGTPCPQVRATLRSHPCPVEQQRPSLGLQPSSASPSASFYFSPLPFTGVWVPRALPDSFLHANLDSVCCPENPLATVSGGGGREAELTNQWHSYQVRPEWYGWCQWLGVVGEVTWTQGPWYTGAPSSKGPGSGQSALHADCEQWLNFSSKHHPPHRNNAVN